MGQRRLRLGIRAQLTLTLLLGALLSTGATLFIANNAIQQYALQQTHTQEQQDMKIALLVLQTQYGQYISISSDNQLVADSPTTGKDLSAYNSNSANPYGRFALNNDQDYVDQVQQLLGGFISVYQCANAVGPTGACTRISTTLKSSSTNSTGVQTRLTGSRLEQAPLQNMALSSANPQEWLGVVTLAGKQYYTDYYPLLNPQQRMIGVLAVGVPLDTVTQFQRSTSIQLLLLGLIIMIAGVIFALLFGATIITTLQNVARQVITASERIGAIAAQQAGGSQQQVWAVNSINKALQNFAETTRDISHRTDQLAQMGNQVIQKRAEISPMQIDSILAYITRSVRDISAASRQEAQQYDRMTSAMQAVIEIAEQVATSSADATDSAQRLDEVIVDLQRIVGVQRIRPVGQEQPMAEMEPAMAGGMSVGQILSQPSMGQMSAYNSMGQMGQMGMGQRGMSSQMMAGAPRSDQRMGMGGGQYMGRMPGTAGDMSGAMGGMNGMYGRPNGAPSSGSLGRMGPMNNGMGTGGGFGQRGQMGQMGQRGQMGGMGGMGPMRGSDQLPPLGPPNNPLNPMDNYGMMNPVSGPMDSGPFGGRRSFGGDQGGEMSMPMPPLPDYSADGGYGRPDMSAPPVARTRGIRGPVSGPRQGGNGAPTRNRLPDWANQDGDPSRGYGRDE
ncbi:MAG: cache domain-containing protein [Ktedonobacterales bacterium]